MTKLTRKIYGFFSRYPSIPLVIGKNYGGFSKIEK